MLAESYELTTTEDGVELPHAELPTALWGYDREAVHEYLERVREAVSDALAARTPDGAVLQKLDQVGQETSAVLRRAHEIAEEVTAKSQAEASERLAQAEEEARALREAAEQRVVELDAEVEKLWAERQRLLADVDRIAEDLRGVIRSADERFPDDADEADSADDEELAGEEQLAADEEELDEVPDDDLVAGEARPEAPRGGVGAVPASEREDDDARAAGEPGAAEEIFGPADPSARRTPADDRR